MTARFAKLLRIGFGLTAIAVAGGAWTAIDARASRRAAIEAVVSPPSEPIGDAASGVVIDTGDARWVIEDAWF